MATKKKAPAVKKEVKRSGPIRGQEGFARTAIMEKERKMRAEKNVFRFALKANEEATIIYLDSDPYFVFEHMIWDPAAKTLTHLVCCKDETSASGLPRPCPVCASGNTSKWTAYLTNIDTRQFTRKDGSVTQNRRVLFGARGPAINRMADIIKKYGDLTGRAFKVKRYGDKDSAVGSSFEFLKKANLEKLPKDDRKPFDYDKILAVPSDEEYAAYGFTIDYAEVSHPVADEEGGSSSGGIGDLL